MPALTFSAEEYAGRLASLRRRMEARGLDALVLLSPENICYFSGYHSLESMMAFAALVVGIEGEPSLVIRRINLRLAKRLSWVETLQPHGDGDAAEVLIEALRSGGFEEGRIGLEEQALTCSVGLHRKLAGARLRLEDGGALALACRRIKSAAEIACVQAAAAMTDIGMAAALAALHPGAVDRELAAAAYGAMVRAGSEFLPTNPIVAAGTLAGVTHANFSGVAPQPGEAVFCHLAAVHGRYAAPLQRTLTVGPPPDAWRRLSEKALRVQDKLLAAIVPGAAATDVLRLGEEAVEREGLTGLARISGISIGLGLTNYAESAVARLGPSLAEPLAANMIFHVTTTTQPRGGPVLSAADLVVVQGGGVRRLATTQRALLWN